MRGIAQSLVDSIGRSLASFGHMDARERIALKLKFLLRRALLALHDPPVEYRVGKTLLRLPLSHKLPIDDAASPDRAGNLARIARQALAHKGSLPFIDIGANVGDTVALLRKGSHFPILAVEGDPEYFRFLEENVGSLPEVWTVRTLLSDTPATVSGELVGNYDGSKQVALGRGGSRPLRFQTLEQLLEQFPLFRQAGMLKIDTDGFDCRIIRGAVAWLTQARPVVFFEYDPYHLAEQGDEGVSVFGALRSAGYQGVLVFEARGDFIFSFELEQERTVQELHCYYTGQNPRKYADLCVFHEADRDLFERCRSEELRMAGAARAATLPQTRRPQ